MTLLHAGGPWRSPKPVLLAERSRTARAESRCCLCSRLVVPGQRVADVVGGGCFSTPISPSVGGKSGPEGGLLSEGRQAHVSCTGRLTAGEQR